MDLPDNNENEIQPLDNGSFHSFSSEIPQIFVNRRRRGCSILAELEPISETNTLSNYSFKGNLSLTDFGKQKRKHDILSRTVSCMSSSNHSNSSFLESSLTQTASSGTEDFIQTTPPSVLKQRLKDVQAYMQKQLDELREFTTAEQQILLAEKGFETLQEEHAHLKLEFDAIQEQNSNLKMELEKSSQITTSQQDLINNLKENFDNLRNKLIATETDKTNLVKELELTKRKLVDEEYKNELIENKLKKREDELKKSLDEAWNLNKIKDERLIQMKDKVSSIYSERIMSNDFLNNSIPIERMKGFDSKVTDLYNLSLSNFDNDASPVFPFKCNCGSNETRIITEAAELKEKLKELRQQLDAQKHELLDLTNKLKEKELDIEFFNSSLNNLSRSFEFHGNEDQIPMNDPFCSIPHENLFDKISCEFSQLRQKLTTSSLDKCTSVLMAVNEHNKKEGLALNSKSDSGVHLDKDTNLSNTDFSNNNLKAIISNTVVLKNKSLPTPSNIIINSYSTESCGNNINFLENQNNEEDRASKDPSYTSLRSESGRENSMIERLNKQEDYKKIDSSCQTIDNIDGHGEKIEIITVSCQTDLNSITITEYENKISNLEKDLVEVSKVASNIVEVKGVCYQTSEKYVQCPEDSNDDFPGSACSILKVNKSIQSFKDSFGFEMNVHKSIQFRSEHDEASCQTDIDFNLSDTSAFKEKEIKVISDYEKEIEKLKSELEFYQSKNPKETDLIHHISHTDRINNSSFNHSFSSALINELKVQESTISCYSDTISPKDSKFTQTDESCISTICTLCILREESINSGNINESASTICESEETLQNNKISETEEAKSISKSFEIDSSNSSDCTFQSTSEFISDKSAPVNSHNMEIMTSSDSNKLESSQNLEKSYIKNCSSTEQTSFLFEYDTFVPDTTTINMTFSNHLEHSILKSKLRTSDATFSEVHDPLAIETEFSKPIVEIPFTYSLGLIGETKILEDKCKILNEELSHLQTYNRKCLSLLTEIDRLLCPQDLGLESDILMKAEETILLIKNVIDAESELNENEGLLVSYKNMKSMFNNLLRISEEMKLLKNEHLSLSSYVHSLNDMSTEILNARAGIADLTQRLDINESSNKLLKDNYENLLKENSELKEQLSQLKAHNFKLQEISVLYDDLLEKNSELQNILLEKEECLKEINDFKYILQSFINNTNKFGIIENYNVENKVFDVGYFKHFFMKIEKMLKELSNSYKVLEGCNLPSNNLTEGIESLYSDKCELKKMNDVLQLNLHTVREKVVSLENASKNFKTSFNVITSDFQTMRNIFSQSLNNANSHIEQLIAAKLNDLNELHKENLALKCQVNEISSCSSKFSESSNKLELALKESLSKNEQLTSKFISIKNENKDLKTSITKLEDDVSIKTMEVENLLQELKKLEEVYSESVNDLKEVNSKHCEVNCENIKLKDVICHLENDILSQKNKINFLEKESKELENMNSELKKKISLYELELKQKNEKSLLICSLQNENEELKIKLDHFKDTERLFSELKTSYEGHSKKIDSLNSNITELKLENEVLKTEQEKYLALTEKLQLLTKCIKSSDDTFEVPSSDNVKYSCTDLFMPIKEVFSELKEARKNMCELKLTLDNLRDEKTALVKNLESLKIEKEMSIEVKRKHDEDMNNLIRKEQLESEQLKEVIRKYDIEVTNVLSLLQYEGPPQITDDSWAFIKQNINLFKSKVMSNKILNDEAPVVLELKNKLMSLETQLLDSDNFKRKFSKEIHEMKPDLKVPDLIKQSLEELQHTFLSTIMEKESAIIADLEKDYEVKLAQSSDRIRQLEEEGKRNHNWIKEIEDENDRLQNDCKRIQHENENLKSDIKEKRETILKLEQQIEKQKDNVNESLYFDPYHQLEQQEKEKSFIECNLQDKINDMARTLEIKNKECQEAFKCLQNKSEKIFQLERTLNDTKIEKSHLEEELKRLKEELISQISSYEENKKKIETEIEHYKTALDNFTKKENADKCSCNIEIPGLVKFLEKLGQDADTFLKDNVENLLDNHLQRVDKLNYRLKELGMQLNNQIGELKNKENIIVQLEAEVSKLREGNTSSKETNDLIKIDISQYETYLKENKFLRKEQEDLKLKLEEMKEDREALIQASIESQNAMKDQITVLNDSLKLCRDELDSYKSERNEFGKIKDEYYKIQEEIAVLNNLLTQSQEEKCILNEQLDHLKTENSEIQNLLQECLTELRVLKEKNKQFDEPDENNLKDELDSLSNKIVKYQQDIEKLQSEKRALTTEFLENIEFERSLLKSAQSELAKKENDLLSLEKEKNALLQELNTVKQSDTLKIDNLENEIHKLKDRNHQLHLELCSLQKLVNEKNKSIENLQSELDSICSTYHSEESCPYKKEALEYKKKIDDCSSQLAHDREIFELWKSNMDQDIQCKVLLIEDLQSKLTKEIQQSKEERALNNELHCKLRESEEKIKNLEDKVTIQRELFSKEKSKLEYEIKKKEMYESKISELQQKSEELVSSINIFLKEVSGCFGKEIPDFGTVCFEINQLKAAIEEEKENVKQLDEECEILNKNITYLESQLGKLYENDCAKNENLKQEMDKLKEEQTKNMKISAELKTAKEGILSLKKELQELSAQYERQKNAYEINIDNLLEDKHKLQSHCSELEKKVRSMASTIDGLQKKEDLKIKDLMSEVNHLKMKIVEKTTKISNLEMRLVGDSLPFQRRAETAEKKVEELSRELKSLKYNLSSRETTSAATSPFSIRSTPESSRRQDEAHHKIILLEEEIRKLRKDKSSLKKIAMLRHKEIKELQERLGIVSVHEFSNQDSIK